MSASPERLPLRWVLALAGMTALAVAMGIGRFAFTPLLPMMLHDRVIDLPGASWLASANYLGYLVGALLCTFQPLLWRRFPAWKPLEPTAWVRGGLVATCGLTLAMALPLPALWPLLRFAAGVASAFVFVYSTGWCLAQLAGLGVAPLGGFIFTGPGVGIVLSGLVASVMVALGLSAATGWLVFGVLAIGLSRLVWPVLRPRGSPATMAGAALPQSGGDAGPASEIILLALAYGLAGFGYIITATFLPVIARGALPGSHWLDLFWPLFGSGVVIGAWLATRLRHIPAQRGRLAAAYAMQAAGVALSLLWPTLAGFALGSLLLGLPFTAITFFAMQEVRRLRPHSVASTTGLLTALYGLGQIAGPPMTAALLQRGGERAGFALALEIASASLVLGALLYLLLARLYPHRGATR